MSMASEFVHKFDQATKEQVWMEIWQGFLLFDDDTAVVIIEGEVRYVKEK